MFLLYYISVYNTSHFVFIPFTARFCQHKKIFAGKQKPRC